MQFHILDENSNPVAIMDNTLSEAIHLKSSKFQSFATGSANYLDFEIDKLHVDSSMFQVGYWIIFKHRGKDQKLYINNVEEAEKDTLMQISAKSANLDLNIEKITPPAPMTAQPITWYFNIILSDTGYTIGTNELSNLTRKLSWDSEEMTRRTLLQSVANQFDKGELEYEEILNSDFTTKERLVHIKKQVGEIRDDIELEYGKNVKTIKRATNIDNMCTAVRPTTTNKDGKVTTIVNEPDWQVLDDDGNIKFYHKKGSEIIFAPIANARYGNRGTNVTSGGYILHKINYENISSSETFTRGKTYIEEYSVPEITYEAEGRTDANPGDTVTIIDKGYNPPLLLSARVLDITDSFDDTTLEGANFGNYKALESQISSDLQDKMAALAEQNAPYSTTTLTTNGVQFKNSQGSTVLTARLFKGTKEIVPDSYIWTKDNITLSVAESTLTVDASDIDEKSVVRWSAVINGVTVAFDEVTITDVSDGANGISPTVTINPDTSLTIVDNQGTSTTPVLKGTDGDDGLPGKDGTGIQTTTITYASSTSGTTAPTSGWTSAVPTVTAGSYLWTKTVWAYTDNTSETGYSVAMMGLKGDKGDQGDPGIDGTDGTSGIIVSSVVPASPQTGQLWQDTSTTPQLVKKWTGASWVIWELYAQNLKSDTLETISAKIGKIYNEFDNSSGGVDNKGRITIEDSVKVVYYLGNSSTTIDLVTSSSGQGLFTQYLPDKNDASKFKQSWYMPTGLYFTDSINNFTGQITSENVSLSSWQNLILNSGYTAGDGVQPQYRRIKNLDGSYSVQFRGAVSPTSGNFPTSQVQVATLSGIYLPPTNAMRQCSDNTGKGGRVAATSAGKLYIWAPNTSSYMYIDALTYIN